MRIAVLQFLAGFCGALGSLFFLLCLGTDYWLLFSESCDSQDKNSEKRRRDVANQPIEKICMPVYLSHDPLPEKRSALNADTALHRTFWCILSILGFIMIMIGVFFTICGIPTANRRLYEAGGALFITGGFLLMVVVVTFAVWVQVPGSLERSILQRRSSLCPELHLDLYYGLSFMLAPPASFFSILCGIFLLLTQTASATVSANSANRRLSVQKDWETSVME